MTRALLIADAHGLDLLTFLLAVSLLGVSGEANGLMQTAYLQLGLAGVVVLKTAGVVALTCIAQMRRWAFVPAAAAGLLGASVNLIAIGVV